MDHIPEYEFCLCIVQCLSSGPHAIRRIKRLFNWQTPRWVSLGFSLWGATKHQHCNSEYAKWHDSYTPEECANEWMQNNADFKWCVMNGFIMSGIIFMTVTPSDSRCQRCRGRLVPRSAATPLVQGAHSNWLWKLSSIRHYLKVVKTL